MRVLSATHILWVSERTKHKEGQKMAEMAERIIGIRHRFKKTAKGEAHPTQICIQQHGDVKQYNLEDETAELDWVLGRFPTKYRSTVGGEYLDCQKHHIQWRQVKDRDTEAIATSLLRREGKNYFVAAKVPYEYDGLRAGDKVAMMLGGSGDRLAYALSRRGEEIGATVYRIPSFSLKKERERQGRKKEDDASLLAELVENSLGLFYPIMPRDRTLILLKEAYIARTDAMKAWVACEQRLRQRVIGQIFCSSEGLYPEGDIENLYDERKANDAILQALRKEEMSREKELTKIVESLDIYQKLFAPIEGVGPMIASRLIVAVSDIRRFPTDAKLKAFCGVHLLEDGRIPRKRSGELANWSNDARQALYLLGDQFNLRPNSIWGKKLREYKVNLRSKHPAVEVVNGKKQYSDIHIHKMAIWRTLTKFTEWLWREWWTLEKAQR